LINLEILIGLPGYQITGIEGVGVEARITARYSGPVSCAHCGGSRLRSKGRYIRQVRHENIGARQGVLELEARKWQCLDCGRYFRQRFPGILPCQRASEAFQAMISASIWMALTAAAWGGEKESARPPSSATSGTA